MVDADNQYYRKSGNCLIETKSKTLICGASGSVIPQDGSVTSIADYAFMGCQMPETIEIPAGVTHIGLSAFSSCPLLTEITVRWTASANATQYNIYRYNGSTKTYVYKGTSYTTSYDDATVKAGTTYYYKVAAVCKGSGLTFVSDKSAGASAKAQ